MKTQELQLGVGAFLHRRGSKFKTENRKSIQWWRHGYVHIFVKCWQNFKIFSLAYSAGNIQCITSNLFTKYICHNTV